MPILAISAALLLLAAPPPASAALPAPGGPLAAALANNAHSLALLKRQRPEDCQWCPDRETGICVYLSSNVAHCGKCGAPCSAGEFCYMGRCRTNEAWCAEQGYQSCPGTPDFACLSDTTPEACGTCGTVCSGATPYCQGGRCTQCLDGDLVCGGVCTALGTDNCGSCNRACPNGTYCNVYVDGKMNPGPYECVPLECGFGTSWCPGLGCVDFRNNDRHCGGCNAACAAGEQCLAGECRPCNATEGGASCGGRCTSLRTDSKNCGSCGRACQFGEMCWEGECGCPSYAQGPAPPNVVDCPLGNGTVERCVDLANRGDHCGACGARCPSKETGSQWMGWCDNGRCDCYPPGTGSRYTPSLTLCGSVCTPTETDGENCGRCSNVCGPGRACHKGECFACERLGMLACAGMDGTCMAPGEYDYRCPAGSLYTSTTASTAGTATATGSATTARPTETVAPPAFAVPPGNATCMRSCPDKGNFLLVRPVLLEGSRLATVQCIGPDGGKCAWFTDAECRSVAPGESAPAPSYDVGYLCSQNTAGWCGAAYGYLWTAPGTPIPGSCPAPAPPTSTEAAVSAGSFTCVRSCLDKGNYLLARTQVERVSSVMTVQCSGTSPTSCGWFSDAACTQVVPGETGGGASGVACAQVEDGWCRAAWNVAALGLPQQNCSFVPTATDSGASATSAPREPTRGSGATAAGTPSSTGAPTAAATPSGSPAAVLTTTNGRPSSAGRVLRGAGSWVPVLLSLGALIAWP
ncbi:hypothetical protein DFJ74DRAFT_704732 [Hyaloraphidium curvatum]|nr:hypothetical protein DFJ74DRAFT_704732 [Hyaloraphidium curvatum]